MPNTPDRSGLDHVVPVDPDLVTFATDLVAEAGAFTLEHFRPLQHGTGGPEVELKGDGSPVTVADTGAERLMRAAIEARFPDDAISGEEEADKPGTSGRRWVIDPIDGTRSFTSGVALYSNLLYLEDEHGPAVGIIGLPGLGELVAAGRGRGCSINGHPCSVSDRDDLDGALIATSSFTYWDLDSLAAARSTGAVVRTWGDGYGYALVASGRAHVMIDPIVNFWDIAACMVVITEAGGRWTTTQGMTPAEPNSFVATNGILHDRALALLRPPAHTRT